jgi:hypothetical protein
MKNLLLVTVIAFFSAGVLDAPAACPCGASRGDWTVRATDDFSAVALSNVAHAPDAADVVCRWRAYRDGVQMAAGTFPLHVFRQGPLRPGQTLTNAVPPVIGEVAPRGGEIALRVRFERPGGPGARATVLAEDQIEFPVRKWRPLPACATPPAVVRGEGVLVFSAAGVTYAFDRRRATLASIVTGDWSKKEWLKEPVLPLVPPQAHLVDAAIGEPVVTNGAATVVGVSRWALGTASDDLRTFEVATRWTVRGDGRLLWESRLLSAVAGASAGVMLRFDADRPLIEYYGRAADDPFAVRGCRRAEEATLFQAAQVRAFAFDAGWDHLSFAAAGARLAVAVTRRDGVTDLTLDASEPSARAVCAFLISPDKQLAAVPARAPDSRAAAAVSAIRAAAAGGDNKKGAATAAGQVVRQ